MTTKNGPPIGALFAAPGTRARASLAVRLERGRTYLLVCTFHDTPPDPQHATLGMFLFVQVR